MSAIRLTARAVTVGALTMGMGHAQVGLPTTGKDPAAFNSLGQAIVDFMNQNSIQGAVFGLMKDGEIIYQQGFGWKNQAQTTPMPYDAMVRVASITKPMTAAVIQRRLAEGDLVAGDFVFRMGQLPQGLLNITPFNTLGDQRFDDITVQHLIEHRGGWDRYASTIPFEPTALDLIIMSQTGIPSPVGRFNKARYVLGFPLNFGPGTGRKYSNTGFMLLGMLAEQVDPRPVHQQILEDVFAPMPWCPLTEVIRGRTFSANQSPREPFYNSAPISVGPSAFPPYLPIGLPYGAWDQEDSVGHGGMVASTTALLKLAEHYYFSQSFSSPSSNIGRYGVERAPEDQRENGLHSGLLPGAESLLRQRADGINYCFTLTAYNWPAVVPDPLDFLFSEDFSHNWFHQQLDTLVQARIAAITNWPTQGVEGLWVDFNSATAGSGSHGAPFRSFADGVSATPVEGSLNLQPGSSTWTGTITKKMKLRAHGSTSAVVGV